MAKTPQQVAAKWRANLVNAGPAIEAGVQGVTEAPGVAAARQKAFWLRRVNESADKLATRVAAVTLDEWKRSMTELAIPRISQGAQNKEHKVAAFMQEFLPYVTSGADRIRQMPKGGLPESIARATAMIQHNAQFKRSGR